MVTALSVTSKNDPRVLFNWNLDQIGAGFKMFVMRSTRADTSSVSKMQRASDKHGRTVKKKKNYSDKVRHRSQWPNWNIMQQAMQFGWCECRKCFPLALPMAARLLGKSFAAVRQRVAIEVLTHRPWEDANSQSLKSIAQMLFLSG